MNRWTQGSFRLVAGLLALLLSVSNGLSKPPVPEKKSVMLVVMDPLAKELACACVKGYGQRDYRKLAAKLKSTLKLDVTIEFTDDLAETMKLAAPGQEVIIAGEQSLVAHAAKKASMKAHPICALTDPEGETTVTGSFVTRGSDSAKELKDIRGRKVFFGLAGTEENQAIAQSALSDAGVKSAATTEQRSNYSDATLDMLDSTLSPAPVAIIPTYALKLLQGCGSVKPGEVKAIGKTKPVPFITIFVTDNIATEREEKILKTLLDIKGDKKLLEAMESRDGFKAMPEKKSGGPRADAASWPDWRGPGRDGHVPRLPPRLPAELKLVWKKAAMTGGLAGLSVSDGRLILAERDFNEENDMYRCLNADTGDLLWMAQFPAPGKLDYGQFPRATPVIHNGRAYLLGAFGELRCLNVATGKVLWKRNLPREFKAELPTWGMSSTPLIVDDLLIVNPGATNASLAALDLVTGRTRWTTPGLPAAYSAFIYGEFGGRKQIVGYDQISLGGWDVKTGKRLWQLVPPTEGDFNVPTPVAVDGGILVSTENNGTRLYHFDDTGRIIPKPAGEFAELSPDTMTPIVTNGRVFGTHLGMRCLDARNGLKVVWHREDNAIGDYATFFADAERVLLISMHGELVLLDAKANDCAIISRLKMFDDDVEVYSHPALAGTRLYARGGSSVLCVDLAEN